MTDRQLPNRVPEVIHQQLADGTVLFHPLHEIYYGLNEVGGRIWELLPPAHQSLAELVDALCVQYPGVDRDVVTQDVVELLTDLQQQGLVYDAMAGGTSHDASADSSP